MPEDIQSGVYDVHVYIDDVEYILDYKIEVLPITVEKVYIPQPEHHEIDRYNYFKIGYNIYYLQLFSSSESGYYSVQYLDMNTLTWGRKNNVSWKGYYRNVIHSALNFDHFSPINFIRNFYSFVCN